MLRRSLVPRDLCVVVLLADLLAALRVVVVAFVLASLVLVRLLRVLPG